MPTRRARVRLNYEAFAHRCGKRGWATAAAQARGLGFSESTISRLRYGSVSPSARFINKCIRTFGARSYADLFSEEVS